jgi:hypothetical protein
MNNPTMLPTPGDSNNSSGDRLIQGIIARWDAERGWHDRDGLPLPSPMIVLGTTQAIQRFRDKQCIKTITTKPLPDVDELNAAVPKTEWELGLSGQPREPYQLFFVVYLLNPIDAQVYTYLNSTTGAEIAVERLASKIRNMRLLRGAPVSPVVTLGEAPMKTSFGLKSRPDFVITDWQVLGGTPDIQGPQAPLQISDSSKEPVAPEQPAEPEPARTKRGAVKNTSAKPAETKTADLPNDDLSGI